jgi:hypothetical protein
VRGGGEVLEEVFWGGGGCRSEAPIQLVLETSQSGQIWALIIFGA